MTIRRARFEIDELDCAEEVLQLRSEFERTPGILELSFDILAGRMQVSFVAEQVSESEIVQRIGRIGMRGRLYQGSGREDSAGPSWRHQSRLALAVGSALFLLLGLLLNASGLAAPRPAGSRVESSGGPVSTDPLTTGPVTTGPFTTGPIGPWAIGAWAARLSFVLSIICGAWYVLPRAWASVRLRRADMNLLMVVAVAGACVIGQWEEAAAVSFLFALALLLEHWSLGRARRAIASLIDTTPPIARCLDASGELSERNVDQVTPGQRIVIRPGEQVPLDGVVRQGNSQINEAPITGESKPAEKRRGDSVYAGTINGSGALEVEVTRRSDDTTVARIIHMVEEAQARRAPSEQWIERFARRYTPAMMVVSMVVAVLPPLLLGGAWDYWVYNALVLLVIACPCALVISTPVTIVSALTSAARAGVLIKGGRFLEEAARIRAMAIDKTGTLTLGQLSVSEVIPFDDHSRDEVLQRAAAMETHSTHPIATAILRLARNEGLEWNDVEQYQALPGQGAEAIIDGRPFWIGNHRLWTARSLGNPHVSLTADRLQAAGNSIVAVGNARHICGLIGTSDQVRPVACRVVQQLKTAGIERLVMVTGDNEAAARLVARAVGLDDEQAELLPADKVRVIEQLRHEFEHVAMVGDGVNDAPALATASIGVAMAAIGSDAAIETADIALMSDDLARLPWLIRHGRRALGIVRQNVAFALTTKLLFVALACAGQATLWMAIAADTGASLLVIFNGMRMLQGRDVEP